MADKSPHETPAAQNDTRSLSSSHHDWHGTTPLSTTIVETIEAADPGYDPRTGESLYSVADVDALERLFAPSAGKLRNDGSVSFRYEQYQVTVYADGLVTVQANPHGSTGPAASQ